jgi:TPP-dependent pyruvate/acetoin dehydrogenase alpha subunit
MSDIQRVLADGAEAVDYESFGLDEGRLQRLYEAMVTTRAVDERAARLHGDGEIGFYVASGGLEAIAVGAALALQTGDWLFPSHRDLGMYLTRGGSMRGWFDQAFGNAADAAKGRQLPGHGSLPDGRFVSVSGRVGAQVTHAVGCAMAIRSRADEICALASFGEAVAGGADYHAAVALAARFRAPVVFVCRTARRSPGAEVGAPASLAQRAAAHGLAAVRVDGSDALAVYRAVREARDTAVKGGGATLIETVVTEAALFGEGAAAAENGDDDPVTRLREFLEHSGLWDPARQEQLTTDVRGRVADAVEAARSQGGVAMEALFDDVYAEVPWVLEEQRERLFGQGGD